MADLAASDLTYAGFNGRNKLFLGRGLGYMCRGTISFGNGALTYPTGGVPLTKGKMGCPRVLRSLKILETNAVGYVLEFDVSAEKLRMFRTSAESVSLSSNSAGTPTGNVAAPTITLLANTGNITGDTVIGVNALANGSFLESSHSANIVNITGVQAPAFTGDALAGHSHTATGTAAVLGELSGGSTAVVATVLEVEAIGY